MKKITLLIVVASFSTQLGCSKVQELDDRTKKMADTTGQMAKTTEEMKESMSHMYPQVRTKEAEDTRNKKMQIILDRESGMGAKIAASAIYFQSFEFQFWSNNTTYDTVETRERLFLDAANEFFRRATDIFNRIDVSELQPTMDNPDKYSQEMAFMALSTAMHMLNHHQEYIHEKTGKTFEVVSFYDLMKAALEKDQKGEYLTPAEAVFVTGTNKRISIELLKARTNMLLGLAISFMVDLGEIDHVGLKEKGSALLAKLSKGKYGNVRLTSLFETANIVTQKEINVRLDGAKKARELLTSIGHSIVVEPILQNILKNLKFDEESMRRKRAASYKDYLEYRGHINQFLKR